MEKHAEVLVIGAGHAGCEAALAAARLGKDTVLFAPDLDKVARMSCNPALGGPGKSQLVREIDALGGEMAKNLDRAKINLRRLNTSKGRAMQVMRAQTDRQKYAREMKRVLETEDNLRLTEGLVQEMTWEGSTVTGAVTRTGVNYRAPTIILTTGTFLTGRIYLGDCQYPAGRVGEPPAEQLSSYLKEMGINMERMNTDTTPRVNGKSIDFTDLDRQTTSTESFAFSYEREPTVTPEGYPVFLTRTNQETHQIIRDNIDRNPRYNGTVVSAHPRYCPSLESKIVDFPDRDHHKVFLEPEGVDTSEYYLQGIYTSSPPDVQEQIVHSMKGLENAHIERYGYGIEYDYIPPIQLRSTLEVQKYSGLFAAGQINGTTGYEEAAGQGILAGINAALEPEDRIVLDRSQAFIGVMIDDLVTKGVDEPYRMLPSRAEYRIVLRENNADLRLTEIGHEVGLINEDRYERFLDKKHRIDHEIDRLQDITVSPNDKINELLQSKGTSPLSENGASLYELLKRPELQWENLAQYYPPDAELSEAAIKEIEIQIKYKGYIEKQEKQIEKFREMEQQQIPKDIDYEQIDGLSTEGQEKLEEVEPDTLGQAERIPGVTRSDITILTIWLD